MAPSVSGSLISSQATNHPLDFLTLNKPSYMARHHLPLSGKFRQMDLCCCQRNSDGVSDFRVEFFTMFFQVK